MDANFKSAVYLKNSVDTSAITVTPVLHLSNGKQYQLPPVNMEPSGTAIVDITAGLQSLGIASYATLSGWVELRYNWPWVPFCATVRDVDVPHSLVFSFGFDANGPLSATAQNSAVPQVIEGAWWKQERNVRGFLALANTTARPVTAVVELSDNGGAVLGRHTATISPQGMKTLDLQELQSATTSEGGIRISYKGQPNELIINGGLQDPSTGYSANLVFATPLPPLPPMAHPSTQQGIAELGLMVGTADPMMRFPVGTTFTPYSVIRNVSNAPISITPTLWWMRAGSPASFQLPQFSLLPYETRSLDMPALLAAVGLKSFSGSLNLVFDTNGKSGLLMAGGSVDQTNTYVFEVAGRGIVKSAGKSLSYWSTADGDDTMVTVWNPADEAQDFIFRLEYSGGHYSLPIHLEGRATRMFNISEIIATQVPDADGNTIPAAIQSGSAQILGSQAENQTILVAMDSGIYNVRKATCYVQCTTCSGATGYSVILTAFGVGQGAQTSESLVAYWNGGSQYNLSSTATWTSSNTSVATAHPGGGVTGVAPGSMILGAGDSTLPVYAASVCAPYNPCPVGYGGGGSASGTVVAIPVNFRQTNVQDMGSGVLQFTYEWDSSSGKDSDLSQCQVQELLHYPGGNPFIWPSPPYAGGWSTPNPDAAPNPGKPGTDMGVVDTQDHPTPWTKPYVYNNFTATQQFQYSCSNVNLGLWTIFSWGPASIQRVVQQSGQSWTYTATKSGSSASATLP